MNKIEILKILLTLSKNKHYATRYINFIFSRNDNSNLPYYENHHILPKCKTQFPQYSDLKIYSWNSIKLSPREHFIAHHLLWKAQGGFMAYAFLRMKDKNKYQSAREFKVTSKIYEQLKTDCAKAQSERIITDETKQRMSKAQLNRPKITCPHCNKLTNHLNAIKYHFDKCKLITNSSFSNSKTNETKNVIGPDGLNTHQRAARKAASTKSKILYIYKNEKYSILADIADKFQCGTKTISKICKNPNRNISLKTYNRWPFLQKLVDVNALKSITYNDLGFAVKYL